MRTASGMYENWRQVLAPYLGDANHIVAGLGHTGPVWKIGTIQVTPNVLIGISGRSVAILKYNSISRTGSLLWTGNADTLDVEKGILYWVIRFPENGRVYVHKLQWGRFSSDQMKISERLEELFGDWQ